MLVLGRKVGEKVVIGDNIVVQVIEVRGDRVKLGFAAPANVPIHRSEVRERIEDDSPVAASDEVTGVVSVELCLSEVACPVA